MCGGCPFAYFDPSVALPHAHHAFVTDVVLSSFQVLTGIELVTSAVISGVRAGVVAFLEISQNRVGVVGIVVARSSGSLVPYKRSIGRERR